MKWIKNIESIARTSSPGECPYCKSLETEYSAVPIRDTRGYIVIWCNKCKKACNISRANISDESIIEKPIPKDLIFTAN